VTDGTPLLALRHISKSYGGVLALDDVDFEVYPGEVVALVGDNGAGKTTLVKVIAGAHTPDRGEIHVDGQLRRFDTPSAAKSAGIEVVHQSLGLLENLSVAANLFLGREVQLTMFGKMKTPFMDFRTMNERTRSMLAQYNVVIDSPKRLVSKLSGGQRQLVAITRGAGWGSRLLVMDEPTAALGIQESAKVLELVRQLKEHSVGVMVISHNLEQVFSMADRVAVMRRGRLVGSVRADGSNVGDVIALITGASEVGKMQVAAEVEAVTMMADAVEEPRR